MPRIRWTALGAVVGALLVCSTAAPCQESAKDQAALATALRVKHVSLATCIKAAATKGKPISAKYEYADGKLQLSVYTEKGGQFSEVVVNHVTGKVAKAEKITDAGDLKDSQAQSAAMAKAKSSLRSALAKAVAANKGYSAVAVTAALKDGKAVAEITLMKGSELKTVTEPLA